MQSSKQKRFLEIPGEETFIGTFQFQLESPVLPIPYAKTLVYPLDAERYTKPMLTSFFYKNTNGLLAPVDLDLPVDHINMDTDSYNTIQGVLHPVETALLAHNLKPQLQLTKKKTSFAYRKSSSNRKNSQGLLQNEQNNNGEQVHSNADIMEQYAQQMNNSSNQPIDFSFQKLKSLVSQSFEKAQSIDVGFKHPHKNLKAKKVYSVLPNFDSIEKQFTQISGMELLNITNDKKFVLEKAQDIDTQQILKYFTQEDDQISQDNVTFKHNFNIIYIEIDSNVGKLKKYDYLIEFNRQNQNNVGISYLKDNFILRKKKFGKNELVNENITTYQDQLQITQIEVDKNELFNKKKILQQIKYPVSNELENIYKNLKLQEKKNNKSPIITFRKSETIEEEWQFDVKNTQQFVQKQQENHQMEEEVQKNIQSMNDEDDEELDLDFEENEFDEDDLADNETRN